MSSKTGYKRKRASSAGRYKKPTKTYSRTTYVKKKPAYAPRRSGPFISGGRPSQGVLRYTTATADSGRTASSLQGEYAGMSDTSKSLILSILDPEMCMCPQRWPNTYGVSSLFKTKNVIDAAFTAKNNNEGNWSYDDTARTAVIVYPQLRNAIFTTNGAKAIQTRALPSINSANIALTSDNSNIITQTFSLSASAKEFSAPLMFGRQQAIFPSIVEEDLLYPIGFVQPDAEGKYPYLIWETTGISEPGQLSLTVGFYTNKKELIGNALLIQNCQAYTAVDSATNAVVNISNALKQSVQLRLQPSAAGEVAFMSFAIRSNGSGWTGQTTISFWKTGAVGNIDALRVRPTAYFMDVTEINNANTIAGVSDEAFVIAQSVLATFEGSSLNNAGQCAMARVPPRTEMGKIGNSVANAENWYEFISSLPINNYNGPTKKGAYAWYLSTDEQGYFYSNANRLVNTNDSYIAFEATASDESQTSLRIMVNTIVQFCTNSTAFEQAPSEFIGQDIEHIRHMLSNIPACYENPTHREQLSRMLKQVGTKAWTLMKNPDTYKKIGDAVKMARAMGEVIQSIA